MAKKTSFDLYRRYREYSREKPRRSPLRSRWVPVIVTVLVCAAVWQVFEFRNRGLVIRLDPVDLTYENYGLEGDLAELRTWLDDPDNVAAYEEVLKKDAVYRDLTDKAAAARALTGRLAAYPCVDSAMLDRIVSVGGNSVRIFINGYDSASGELLFQAESRTAIDAPGYVDGLERLGLFQDVSYTGYSYRDDLYALQLSCTLRTAAGRKEGSDAAGNQYQ